MTCSYSIQKLSRDTMVKSAVKSADIVGKSSPSIENFEELFPAMVESTNSFSARSVSWLSYFKYTMDNGAQANIVKSRVIGIPHHFHRGIPNHATHRNSHTKMIIGKPYMRFLYFAKSTIPPVNHNTSNQKDLDLSHPKRDRAGITLLAFSLIRFLAYSLFRFLAYSLFRFLAHSLTRRYTTSPSTNTSSGTVR